MLESEILYIYCALYFKSYLACCWLTYVRTRNLKSELLILPIQYWKDENWKKIATQIPCADLYHLRTIIAIATDCDINTLRVSKNSVKIDKHWRQAASQLPLFSYVLIKGNFFLGKLVYLIAELLHLVHVLLNYVVLKLTPC